MHLQFIEWSLEIIQTKTTHFKLWGILNLPTEYIFGIFPNGIQKGVTNGKKNPYDSLSLCNCQLRADEKYKHGT